MFRLAKQTDVKFFRYTTHTPYLASPLDGGIEQCTRQRGQHIMFATPGRDPHQRNLFPDTLDGSEPEIQDLN